MGSRRGGIPKSDPQAPDDSLDGLEVVWEVRVEVRWGEDELGWVGAVVVRVGLLILRWW